MATAAVTVDPTTRELKSPNPLNIGNGGSVELKNGGSIIGDAGSTVDLRNSTVLLPSAPSTVSNIVSVPTMAALRGTSVAGVPNGIFITLVGFAASQDGGGGLFVYSSSSAATDDGGTVIAPTVGSGRWLRVYSGALNVRWFGAKGDGVADDTTAMQAAIAAVLALGGGEVFAPRGTYNISAALALGTKVMLRGEGWQRTIIQQTTAATSSVNIFNVDGAAVIGVSLPGQDASVIHVKASSTDVSDVLLRDVWVPSMGTSGIGIYLEASATKTIYFPVIDHCILQGGGSGAYGTKTGIKIGSGAGMISVVGTQIFGGRIWRMHNGIHFNQCDTVFSFGLAMDDCNQRGLYFERGSSCILTGLRMEPATFGLYWEFTADSAENFVETPGIESATLAEVVDNGIRNSWRGSNGSGGLIDKYPYAINFGAALAAVGAITAGGALTVNGTGLSRIAGLLKLMSPYAGTLAAQLLLTSVAGPVGLSLQDGGNTGNHKNLFLGNNYSAPGRLELLYNAVAGTDPDTYGFRFDAINLLFTVFSSLNIGVVASYPNNAAAGGAGLTIGTVYRNGDVLQVVHA